MKTHFSQYIKLITVTFLFALASKPLQAQDGTVNNSLTPSDFSAGSYITSIVILSDGDMIVGGTFTSYNGNVHNRIVRLNPDGNLDTETNFNTNTGTGFDGNVNDIEVLAGDKLLIGGAFNNYGATAMNNVIILNADGTVDPAFDTGTNLDGQVHSVNIDSNNKILVGGEFASFGATPTAGIARLNTDGSLDNTFNNGGSGITGTGFRVYDIEIQSDDRIIVAGTFTGYNDGTTHLSNSLARLNTDGKFDDTFVVGSGVGSDFILDVALTASEQVVIAGGFMSYNGTQRLAVAMVNTDGSLNTGFVPPNDIDDAIFSVGITHDQKIILGGGFTSFNGASPGRLVKVNQDGSLVSNFDASGLNTNSQINKVVVKSDTEILIGGGFTTPNPTNNLALINNTSFQPFVTRWVTSDGSITIPTSAGIYNYDIKWTNLTSPGVGDGFESNQTADYIINGLTSAHTYQVEIRGDFPHFYMNNNGFQGPKLRTIEQWGDIQWENMAAAFYGCTNLVYNATDIPDLSLVTDMSRMFSRCSVFNGDINNWDVSNVTNMSFLFETASIFNQNLDNWDVSSVTNMSSMFNFCSDFNGNINNWNVSNVTNMNRMFRAANAFNQNIGNWTVSSVTNMGEMFSLARAFNQDIGTWNVSSVTNMSRMFFGAEMFNQNLNGWDVSSVTNMSNMFAATASGTMAFNQPLGDWNVSSVNNMSFMFARTPFNQDIGNWDVSSVANMGFMFRSAEDFNQDLRNWDVSSVTTMRIMFERAYAFNQNLGDWDISNVTDMVGFFNDDNISRENYDSTLVGWASLPSLQPGVTIGVRGLDYCEGVSARQAIIDNYGWTFDSDGPLCPNPTLSSSDIVFSNIGQTQMDISWTAGDGEGRVVLVKEGGAVDATPTDLNSYTANSSFGDAATEIGSGNFVVYNDIGNNFTLTGLNPNSVYHIRIFDYNGPVSVENYRNNTATGNPTSQISLATQPTVQASNISFANVEANQMDITWDNGDGTNRIVVVKAGSIVDASPTNTYTANAAFGSGDDLGTGNFAVYNGTGNTFTLTNLIAGTDYHVRVFEFNGAVGAENYNLNPGTSGNPANQITLLSNLPVVNTNTGLTLNEGATATITTTQLSSSDVDNTDAELIYSVTTTPTNGQLELSSNPGVAITSFTQDDLVNNLIVYVHDDSETINDNFDFTLSDGINTLAATAFAITVTPVDDPPVVDTNTDLSLNEGATATISTSELSSSDVDNTATELAYNVTTIPSNGQLELSSNPAVAITSFTQDDLVNNLVVYAHNGSSTTTDNFDFALSDGVNTLSATTFNININLAPVFTSANTTNFDENSTATVIDVQANDGNGGGNDANLTYSITGGADASFFGISAADGLLTFNTSPNYENPQDDGNDNTYIVEVTATDADGGLTTVQTITVTVDDVTELATFTIDAIANVAVDENIAYTSAAPSITGTPIGALVYSLGGTEAADFTINTSTGVVGMVARDFENPVDANTDNIYEVTITATDADGNTAAQSWIVTVDDVIESATFTIDAIANAAVDENIAYTSVTPSITGTPIGALVYSLGGTDAADFSINTSTGVVGMVARDFENPLDANTDNIYEVTITATDADGNTAARSWMVTVNDVIESATFTIDAIANAAVDENITYTSVTPSITGTPIGALVYSLGGTDAADFTINTSTGVVSMVARDFENPLDANTDNIYEVAITATDADGNTATQSWTVTINDVIESATFTIDAIANVIVDENIAYTSVTPSITGTPIGTLTYSLGGTDAADFTINTSTGVVGMVARDFENPLDANTDNIYEVTITATDADGNTATRSWTVTINNLTESATFTIDAIANEAVDENIAYTSVTPSITGTPIGALVYSLGGTDAADFTINTTTGVVDMVARDFENPLDTNTDNIYEVTITATDADGNTAAQSWTVTINDVIESATFTIDAIANVIVDENIAYTSVTPSITGTPIGTLTYSLGGTDAADFTINTSTGVVGMVARDFENPVDANTDNIYEVNITATDADGNTATQSWTVTVNDVIESAPAIELTFNIDQLIRGNSYITTIDAADFNTGNTFTLELSDASGNFASPVSLATLDGTFFSSEPLSFTVPISIEDGQGYALRVTGNNPTTLSNEITDLTIGGIPEIQMLNESVDLGNNSEIDFGSIVENTSTSQTLTISNQGTADLTISDIQLNTGTAYSISGITLPATITAGNTADFIVTLSAATAQTWTDVLTITSDDADENPFTLNLTGVVTPTPLPEIQVLNGTTDLVINETIDFGNTVENISTSQTLTINNTGTSDLNISDIQLNTGTAYSISGITLPATISTGGSTDFTITLSSATAQTWNDMLTISSDDADQSDFTLNLTGTVTATPEPEIQIFNGATSLSSSDVIDFGSILENLSTSQTLTINNSGTAALVISDIQLTNGVAYTISGISLPSTIEAGTSTNVTITLSSATAQTWNDILTIRSDDADESDFTLNLTGEVTSIPPPTIDSFTPSTAASGTIVTIRGTGFTGATAVTFGGTDAASFTVISSTEITAEVASGNSGSVEVTTAGGTASLAGFTFENPEIAVFEADNSPITHNQTETYDFGTALPDETVERQFTIENTGTSDLLISNISSSNEEFEVLNIPDVLSPGSSTQFSLRLNGLEIGTYNSEIIISNNSVNASEFIFTVSAEITGVNVIDNETESIIISNQDIDLGETFINIDVDKNFKIENLSSNSTIQILSITVDNPVFQIINAPTTIAPLSSAEFTVRLNASAVGGYRGTVSVMTNLNDFSFQVMGEVLPEASTEIKVFNVVTPNGDGRHDFLQIENITEYPSNMVFIFNRWGDKVFEINNYDNSTHIFEGISDKGEELLTGNYYYVIDKGNGEKRISGFLIIKR